MMQLRVSELLVLLGLVTTDVGLGHTFFIGGFDIDAVVIVSVLVSMRIAMRLHMDVVDLITPRNQGIPPLTAVCVRFSCCCSRSLCFVRLERSRYDSWNFIVFS